MAWLSQFSTINEDCPTYEMLDGAEEWLTAAGEAIKEPLTQLPYSHPDFMFQNRSISTSDGFRFPDFGKPIRIQIKRMIAPLPDFMGMIVTRKIIDFVETAEPSVHHFMPVEVILPDGSIGEPRWLLNICVRLDSMILEQCEGVFEIPNARFPDYIYYNSSFDRDDKIVLRKSITNGHVIWWEPKLQVRFLSNEFHDFIVENKLRGPYFELLGLRQAMEV